MEDFRTYKLGDIVNVLDYKRIPLSSTQRQNKKGIYPYYGAQGIIDYINDYIFDGEYLLIAEDGENLKSQKQHIAQIAKGKYWVNNHAHIVESNGLCDIRYVYYLLNKMDLSGYITGSAQPKLNQTNLLKIELQLPSLKEQYKIAEFLHLFDDKIELNRRINENLEQQAQALFKSWFVDFEPFKNGKFVDSELGMIPEELNIRYIGDIPHTIESGKRPKGGAVLKGIPSIGAENIKGLGYYDYSKTKYIPKEFALTTNRGKINGYELLIYKDGGKPGYFIPNYTIFGDGFPFDEMFINEHVFKLDLLNKEYNIFAYFYMQTPFIMNQLNSIGGKAAIPGINTKDVESLPIFNGDNKKIQEFGNHVLPMIITILRNCNENARLAQLRDTLLPHLMSGELKISNTDSKNL